MTHSLTIENFSRLGGTQHVLLAVPAKDTNTKNMTCYVPKTQGHHAAFKWRRIGDHTDLYYTSIPMKGGQLVDAKLLNEPPEVEPFEFHPWCSDGQNDLRFVFAFAKDGEIKLSDSNLLKATQISQSKLHREFELTYAIPEMGIFVEFWATYFSRSPVVWINGFAAWHEQGTDKFDVTFDQVWVGSGERFYADYRAQYGSAEPAQLDGITWGLLTDQGRQMHDGTALDVRGQLLCTPANRELTEEEEDELSRLVAAADGRGYGLATPWDGPWHSHGHIPRMAQDQLNLDTLHDRMVWAVDEVTRGDRYQERRLGNLKVPSSTGDQEDFGATKGTHAVAGGDPGWVERAAFSVMADFYRGYCRYEADGSIVTMGPNGNHPGIRIYNGGIHYRTSDDQLGKPDPLWGQDGSTTFARHDDEHDSNNNLTAYYLLTGDRRVQRLLDHRRELYEGRITPRMGAVRAAGRMSHCMANLQTCGIECYEAWKRLADDVMQLHRDRDLGPEAEVYVLGTQRDLRTGVFDINGNPLTCWNAWEAGLWAVGWYAGLKVFKDRLMADGLYEPYMALLRRVCRTVTLYATWWSTEGGGWRWANNVAYLGAEDVKAIVGDLPRGTVLPEQYYLPEWVDVGQRLVNDGTGSGVDTWTRQALLIGHELESGAEDGDSAVVARVRAVLPNLAGEANDRRTAEWMACVRG